QLDGFLVGVSGFGKVGGCLFFVGGTQLERGVTEGEISVGEVGPDDLAARISNGHTLQQIDSLTIVLHLAGGIGSGVAGLFQRIGLAKLGIQVGAAKILFGDLGVLILGFVDRLLLFRSEARATGRRLLGDLGEIEVDLI